MNQQAKITEKNLLSKISKHSRKGTISQHHPNRANVFGNTVSGQDPGRCLPFQSVSSLDESLDKCFCHMFILIHDFFHEKILPISTKVLHNSEAKSLAFEVSILLSSS